MPAGIETHARQPVDHDQEPKHMPLTEITFDSIKYLKPSFKKENDKYNKIRESIIVGIINNTIDTAFYHDHDWADFKLKINSYVSHICKVHGIDKKDILTKHAILMGGRGNHYDIMLTVTTTKKKHEFRIEWKFNATSYRKAPQFASFGKPSQYLNMNFEEYFYDNYLEKIATYGDLPMPPRDEYLKQIHSTNVKCLKLFKDKYSNNKDFNIYCNINSKEAIKNFIQLADFKDNFTMSNYLLTTQKNKYYMCYKNGKIYYEEFIYDINMFNFNTLIKKDHCNYLYLTDTGELLEIKLRFKNGNGLQFPAFQLKFK